VRPLAALALLALGCGGAQKPSRFARPIDEDLVALLPAGADLVIDVDAAQLRDWEPLNRVKAVLPDEAIARLGQLGVDSLGDVEAIALAASRLGLESPTSTVVVRGDLDLDKAARGLGETPIEVDYRGAALREVGDDSVARLTPRLFAFGARAEVRRVVDLVRGEGESVRTARGDAQLMTALGRCPTAKSGRPAIFLAAVFTGPLREQIRKEGLPGGEVDWVALSFAVGDGFDAGGVFGTRGEAEARALFTSAKRGLEELKQQRTVRLLGLRPFLDPIVIVGRDDEVHFAYRLSGARVEQAVRRFESLYAKRSR
jgi:hypothetical protein